MTPVRPPLAVAGLVLVGVLVGSLALLQAQREVPVEMFHPEIDPARFAAWLEAVRAAPEPTAEDMAPVVDAFVALNRAEVEANARPGALPHDDHAYAAALDALRARAEGFANIRGPEALMWLGRRRGLVLAGALREWLKVAAATRLDPAEALSDERARPYVDAGGAFVRFAESGGFVEAGALREDRLPMLQALFAHHWAGLVGPRVPLEAQLRADEREWTLRWRVELQEAAPLERRLAAAEALEAVPGYPAKINAAVLLYRAGRATQASPRREGRAGPRAVVYRRSIGKRAE